MNDTEKVLMNRDGLTATEAKREFNRERSEVLDAIENGATYDDIEENYIVSNKTKNIINRVKNLESILEIISLKLPTNKHLA